MKAILCDIDGVIADGSHRIHFLKNQKKDWAKFYGAASGDLPRQWCIDLIDELFGSYEIVLITGRPERYRALTTRWLREYNVPHDELYMRSDMKPDGTPDHRQDYDVKKEIYEWHLKHKDIRFVIEDRKQAVEMWRSLGLVCLQCSDDIS